jgi:hypothetical protein
VAGLIWGVLGTVVAFGFVHNTYRSRAALVWDGDGERAKTADVAKEISNIKLPAALDILRKRAGTSTPLAELARQIDYSYDAHDKLLELSADGASPRGAEQLAQKLVQVFLEQQRAFARKRTGPASAEIEKDLALARSRLNAASSAYDAFRAQNAATGAEPQDPSTLASSTAAAAKPRVPAADTKTNAKSPKAPRHSTLWKYLAQDEDQRRSAGGRNALGGIGDDPFKAANEERSLRAEVDAERTRVATLEQAQEQARNADSVVDDEFRVVTAPSAPLKPERGKQMLIALSMPLGGMLLAFAVLLMSPLLDGKVYTAREAAFWSKLPVLASSAWPKSREMFFPLVDEIGQEITRLYGVTLVIGATGAETPLAEEVASWLNDGVAVGRRSASVPAGPDDGLDVRQKSLPNSVRAWLGEVDGPSLRRAVRVADRVIVLITSGAMSPGDVRNLRTRLGRTSGVGIVVLGLNTTLVKLPDQSGEVARYWSRFRRTSVRA